MKTWITPICVALGWAAPQVASAEVHGLALATRNVSKTTTQPTDDSEPPPDDVGTEPVPEGGDDPPDEPPGDDREATIERLSAELSDLKQRQEATDAQLAELAEFKKAQEAKDESATTKKKADDRTPEAYSWDQWTGGNAMATRVTFAFGDDNLLAGPRDRSPQAGFSLPDDQLFFEQLTQEKRGYETETQFLVYKRMKSYFKHLDAEAALVIEFQNFVNEQTFRNETIIGDDGSYLKLNYYFKPNAYQGDKISLTMFPFDSQRFLLGYTFDITWGGERIFPNNTGQVPGLRLKADWNVGTGKDSYAFLGAKSARLLNDEINETQTYYGALGGFGIGFTNWLMWEVNGGYFQRGAFPPQGVNFSEVGGRTAQSFGGSTRLSFHRGTPVGTSIDFRLFKYSPDATLLLTQPIHYDDKIAFSIAPEFTAVGQTLLEWENPGRTTLVPALAGALINKLRIKKWRLFLNGIYRSAGFVVFNIPGIAPYRAFPDNADVKDEIFGAFGVDYFFERPHLTPGVVFAFKRPASYTSNGVTTVLRDEDDWETLPQGEDAFDIFSTKLTLRWDVARFFIVVSEVRYELDKNKTKFVGATGESGRRRVFQDTNVTNRLGFFILAQARW